MQNFSFETRLIHVDEVIILNNLPNEVYMDIVVFFITINN